MPPFSLQPDPGAFYPGTGYPAAKDLLDYAAIRREGVVVITGDVGCGKTILVHQFLRQAGGASCIGVISNPGTLGESPMTAILVAFAQPVPNGKDVLLHAAFREFLQAQHAQGKATMLVVDEAQNLSLETLEQLRMLTNPEVGGAGVLQLVLVGQAELRQMLYRPDLSQLQQRVVAHYHLQPMSQAETALYITYRLQIAGRRDALFTPHALAKVFQGARGIPRMVNMICDSALLYGYTEELEQIDAAVIDQVVAERGLTGVEPAPRSLGTSDYLPAPASSQEGAVSFDREMAMQLFRGTKK